jgi:chitosanase
VRHHSPLGNIKALIANGWKKNSSGDKMFYGIYGDSDGDSPEEIGEASWLMARTCFPDDDLNGNSGHTPADVTCKRYFSTVPPFPFLPMLS